MRRKRKISFRLRECTAEIEERDAAQLLRRLPPESADLVITSPPYCMGMEYERSRSPTDFILMHRRLLPLVERLLKPGGSVCWQVGHHVDRGEVVPLDALVYQIATDRTSLKLRNRIVWTFGHGSHCLKRFSGRHETVLWFTKGDKYHFDVDAVRVPQKYPGKRAYKGTNKGQWSGNPKGKNPGDVWDIPNVKSKHPEKTDHPCQFPIALAQRIILSMTPMGGMVVDPFLGSGTTAVAALNNNRCFIGSELRADYIAITEARLNALRDGSLKVRPDVPPRDPQPGEAVAKRPPHFRTPWAA